MGTDHHGNQQLPLETPNQQQLQPLIDDELSHVLAVYNKIDGNRMLPLETPNQQQLQPLKRK
jgi:hypothetical protein